MPKEKREMRRPPKQNVTAAQLALKTGDPVNLLDDFGNTKETIARSEPWQLGHGDWVIKVEGVSGGYDLSRITPR
jgi:hypothetical protein